MNLRRKILIIEDNEWNRALLAEILSSEYDTLEAENGKAGLEILEKEKEQISLILLDIRMPKMTGIEVVQAAVESGYTGKFIILSGVTDFKLAQTARRYGVDFYLTKPIDEDELEQAEKIEHFLTCETVKNLDLLSQKIQR